MALRVVLDSDVLIDLLAGREPAATVIPNLLETGVAGTTAVTAYELYSGATRGRVQQHLDELLEAMAVLPLDKRAARHAGAVDLALRQRGQPINPGDNLIAGICLANGVALVTRNISHFQRVADLKVTTLENFI